MRSRGIVERLKAGEVLILDGLPRTDELVVGLDEKTAQEILDQEGA